jgi:hypothetical protein
LRPHKFLNAAAQPDGIPNRFRAAVMGDWGTGLYGAPQCARSISGASTAYNLILHLGDVYYAGTDGEVQQRMLDIWPSVPGAMSRALNGNHEMYSGGQAYYKKALPMFGQAASYFALQNDYWVLIGLDSAYRDYDLHPNQVPWLRKIIGSAGGRKVVLFSHHQPFSLLDSQGPRLVAKLSEWLGAGRVFAWYWGHEHRCLFYEPHPAWSFFGRCIGHSGYPYFRSDVVNAPAEDNHWRRLAGRNLAPAARVLDGPNPFVTGEEERYGPNGYLTLEFDDDRVNEIVHLATGEAVYERELR